MRVKIKTWNLCDKNFDNFGGHIYNYQSETTINNHDL